jgi:tRNA(Ile)-lysidine synthase
MLNKLQLFITEQELVQPGEEVVCAVSGGADSVALLFALYLLKEKLQIRLSAAHFNHHLRGAESDQDQAFVEDFCSRYDIPLYKGGAAVETGPKGLEAAARDARYGYLKTLPGRIATAHTADDNAETVLMHLIRGTGLKGLGGIAPKSGKLIRPMLTVTRQDVMAFLQEWNLPHVEDQSNHTDQFLRNRLRHHVMPLLNRENPRLAENVSAMAMQLRQEEHYLSRQVELTDRVSVLREMDPALRNRALESFLRQQGVKEPQREQIQLLKCLVFSNNPSARGAFPGRVTIGREYDRLLRLPQQEAPDTAQLTLGSQKLPQWKLEIHVSQAQSLEQGKTVFTVQPEGKIVVRSRLPGDRIRLPGGSKTLKKLFIDEKIPAWERPFLPVLADEKGVLAVVGIGVNLDRGAKELPAVRIEAGAEKEWRK